MTNIKKIIAFITLTIIIYACGGSSSSSSEDNFDHEAQALIDNDSLIKFLKNYYFDVKTDSIRPLVAGQTALFEDSEKLKTMEITENDIDYKLYYYVNREGTPTVDKGKPSVMDSVFTRYYGQRIIGTDSITKSFDSNTSGVWFTLSNVIRGRAYGFSNFKNGDNITDNGPFTYKNAGKGILFIPSGLAYRNIGSSGSILENENLIFYIDLLDFVKDTDYDNDGVPSIYEDPDGDGNPRNDDTDNDNVPNYADPDDDGDGVLTRDEDTNNDGDPSNDFSNGSTIPNYLNPDVS